MLIFHGFRNEIFSVNKEISLLS
uniref:Uncharacterized protein n=1 Tax=Rhizophora mucronata TaxID=61149 RepID=A0A2P2QXG2_RHIMU